MTFWHSTDAEKATGGLSTAAWQAGGAQIDSRAVKPGDLFFALQGEKMDGHLYAAKALQNGAAAAVVNHIPAGLEQAPLLIVPDVEKALWDLARYNRARTKAKLIGITGSVGKTSTKEMLKLCLSAQGTCYATEGNFNNHLGVPLSLVRFNPANQFGVFEMGMNHANEIRPLSKLVQPHVVLITTVEAVHLEFFDSVAGIADAKSEIFEGLLPGGVGIINADNPYAARQRENAAKAGVNTILQFGEAEGADFRLLAREENPEAQRITLQTPQGTLTYTLGVIGKHMGLNSLGILAGIHALGADVAKAAAALAGYVGAEGRGNVHAIQWEGKQFTLIDDSYNASPASMRAAFGVLKQKAAGGRTVAALGEMRELGSNAPQFHRELAESLKQIDLVLTAVGDMRHLHEALTPAQRGPFTATAEELLPALKTLLKNGDTLLLKGSHGSLIYQLAEKLKVYAVSLSRAAG